MEHRKLRQGQLKARIASQYLYALADRLSTPVLFVNRAGVLRHANPAGIDVLSRAQYLAFHGGRVSPSGGRQERQFVDMLAASLSAASPAVASPTMRLADGEGQSIILVAQTLRGPSNLDYIPRRDVVLFLIHPNEMVQVNTIRLQIVFGFTPETRLAEHLISGNSLSVIGEKLRVSRETLKSQLRSLFHKTETHRQGELIALLLSSVAVPME